MLYILDTYIEKSLDTLYSCQYSDYDYDECACICIYMAVPGLCSPASAPPASPPHHPGKHPPMEGSAGRHHTQTRRYRLDVTG